MGQIDLIYKSASLLKNKGSLLASMVPWRTFTIHGIFLLHKYSLVGKGLNIF